MKYILIALIIVGVVMVVVDGVKYYKLKKEENKNKVD